MIFKRTPAKNTMSLKFRCTTGPRKNKIVADLKQCGAAPNIKKAAKMKQTRSRTKVKQARKTRKTKRLNPISKLASRLNKLMRR